LTVALLLTLEAGDGAEVPLETWAAVCHALGTSLGHALVRAEEAAGADTSGQDWADAPTDVLDLGDRTPVRPQGSRPLGAQLGQLRSAANMSLAFAAHSLWWSTSHLRMIEDSGIGVSAAELLGILALYGVTGSATADWVRLIPLPCQHPRQSPVWMCDTCRAVIPSMERTENP
jgi:hypothetical protein